jgi:flavodoxin
MKQLFMLFAAILMSAMLLTSCSKENEEMVEPVDNTGKTLVVYYSYTGHCREIVQTLTSKLDADVVEILTVAENQDYNANGYALGNELLQRINADPENADSYPAIKPVDKDCANYDNIIFVTPLWHSQMAAPAQSYLFQNRSALAGKHFGMIVSSHSSGISTVVSNAHRLVPDVIWMGESLWINNSNHSNRASLIEDWLKTLEFAKP